MRTTVRKCGQALVIGLFAFVLLANCALAKDKVEEQFHQSYALNPDGQVRLDNVNGKIHITAWDRQEIQVDAVKRADNQQDLAATKIEIDAKAERIKIHTKHPNSRKNNSTTVDYEVKVPTGAHLAAVETVNGSVEIAGVRGPVNASSVNGLLAAKGLASDTKLETVNGKVEAVFDRLDGVKSISMDAVNGRLELTLPADANAEVKAESLNGRIEADKLTVKKNWPVGSELHGKLGQGGTRVKAETVNGGIRVKLAGPEGKAQVEQPAKG
ncbi:MAG TPA: DUF4097 family beta strand repeat-containing protein [Verrucomicrobiae bacterium]